MPDEKPKIDVGPTRDPKYQEHFDDASYGLDEDTHSEFRAEVRQALVELKGLMDDCEEIWSSVGEGIQYIRAMSIIVQEVNKVSSNATGRILVYSGWQKFEVVERDR